MKNISPLYQFSLKGGGWDEQRQPKMQPSAEIVRVECAKCRRECDLSGVRATLCGDRACRVRESRRECALSGVRATLCGDRACRVREIQADLSRSRATLCGDRACRVREMQVRARFVPCARNPLRRSCVSSARNAGESAIGSVRAQPSAEIVRVECAKCRRECDLSHVRATLCGDRPRATLCGVECAKRRHWRLSSTSLVRGESGEREDENWRLYNFSRRSNLWSWKLRTGGFVVQL